MSFRERVRESVRERPWRYAAWLSAIGLLAAVLILLPSFTSGYQLRVVTRFLMMVGLAQGLNVVAGFARYPALGNVAFWGLGAYVGAIAMNHGSPFLVAIGIAAVACGLVAFALGGPFMRLRGSYFLMATIGLNEVMRQVVTNFFTEYTGGGLGVRFPLLQGPVDQVYSYFYFTMAGLAVLATVLVAGLKRSRIGLGMQAIGADEHAAIVLGVPTAVLKSAAWATSAAVFGAFGVAYGYWTSYIDPLVAFDIIFSVEVFIVFLIGGAGWVLGPLLGATVVQVASEVVWVNFLDLHTGALGVLMVATVLLLPRGGLGAALAALGTRIGALPGQGRSDRRGW